MATSLYRRAFSRIPTRMIRPFRPYASEAQAEPKSNSQKMKTFSIYRCNPDNPSKPSLKDYEINLKECGPMVLDALIKIKNEIDPSCVFLRTLNRKNPKSQPQNRILKSPIHCSSILQLFQSKIEFLNPQYRILKSQDQPQGVRPHGSQLFFPVLLDLIKTMEQAQRFYGINALGMRNSEWDLNNWKWDGDLFIASQVDPASTPYNIVQKLGLGFSVQISNNNWKRFYGISSAVLMEQCVWVFLSRGAVKKKMEEGEGEQ